MIMAATASRLIDIAHWLIRIAIAIGVVYCSMNVSYSSCDSVRDKR